MRTPTPYEIENVLKQLFHYAEGYDPAAAREYYLRTRELKGRRRGRGDVITEDDPRWNPKTMGNRRGSVRDPRTGKTREQIAKDARSKQRKELSEAITRLTKKLDKLEALIKEKETQEKSENRKSKAKRERAAKEKDKPKTAAEKAKDAREAEKYRDKNQQKLKSKAGDKKSGGGSSGSKKKSTGERSVSELRSLATKVRGQIAVAKQKLAAL